MWARLSSSLAPGPPSDDAGRDPPFRTPFNQRTGGRGHGSGWKGVGGDDVPERSHARHPHRPSWDVVTPPQLHRLPRRSAPSPVVRRAVQAEVSGTMSAGLSGRHAASSNTSRSFAVAMVGVPRRRPQRLLSGPRDWRELPGVAWGSRWRLSRFSFRLVRLCLAERGVRITVEKRDARTTTDLYSERPLRTG